jgi:nucleoside-diphosphate-sugar epimerase
VRVIVSRPPESTIDGLEAAIGDPDDPDTIDRATRGARIVIHTGNGPRATDLLIHACLNHNVEKLVHLSALDVLDLVGRERTALLRESARLETRPTERDERTRQVIESEQIVSLAAAQHRLPAVILRVGQLFGEGVPLVTPDVALACGNRWIVLGDGRRRVPLIHIDDVVDAVLRAAAGRLMHGEIVHLIDDVAPTQNEVLAVAVGSDATIVRLPRWLVIALSTVVTGMLKVCGRTWQFTPYRVRAAMSRCTFGSNQRELLDGWRPTVGLDGAILRNMVYSRGRSARAVPVDELFPDSELPSLRATEPRA